jgi:AcrR family transcriptional regulator
MSNDGTAVSQRRRSGEATRRRVLDAVIDTVRDVGYYKATSNEIARRAGVTWGAIQHLFGSREQMMLEVVQDMLAERLEQLMNVLAEHYEDPAFLVELQILLDLSVNPGLSASARDELRRTAVVDFSETIQPLFVQALGPAASEKDLVDYIFATMVAHLGSQQIGQVASELPDPSIMRSMLLRALASFVHTEIKTRELAFD